ncbi:MAG: hypothetical protein HYT97_03135 [Elusimicrobia bacterium]|nr:hypothetical protein [Elusimicrobiota bacterium]
MDEQIQINELMDAMDYDPQYSLVAIHGLVHSIYSWRNNLNAEIKEPSFIGNWTDHNVEEYVEMMHESKFRDVVCSLAMVGVLASFFESLLIHEFKCLRVFYRSRKPLNSHNRWHLEPMNFWDPRKVLDRNSQINSSNNIMRGTHQLVNALGIESKLPADFLKYLGALITYRNFSLHNGYEWPKDKRVRFLKLIEDKNWIDYFNWSKSDGNPHIIYMSDKFVWKCFLMAQDAILAFEEIRFLETNLWGKV